MLSDNERKFYYILDTGRLEMFAWWDVYSPQNARQTITARPRKMEFGLLNLIGVAPLPAKYCIKQTIRVVNATIILFLT